jgi:hypothetical protein
MGELGKVVGAAAPQPRSHGVNVVEVEFVSPDVEAFSRTQDKTCVELPTAPVTTTSPSNATTNTVDNAVKASTTRFTTTKILDLYSKYRKP